MIDDDAALLALDARDVEIEIVDVRHAAGAVHGQVGLEAPLAAVLATAHDHAASRRVDAADLGVQLHPDAELARALDEQVHHIGVERLERSGGAVKDGDLGARARGDVGKLERDVATADKHQA